MKTKFWLGGYFIILLFILGISGILTYNVDPFFHYHKPLTDKYYYSLNNQRSQNDGICRHFDYDALITGSSMSENFSTSEMDSLFGTTSIKIPFSGSSYRETDRQLRTALKYNPDLKIIIRGLDMLKFVEPADTMRSDLGVYPFYLYDENPLNDVHYLFNKSVLFDRVYSMKNAAKAENFKPGITSFDSYSNWQASFSCGKSTARPQEIHMTIPEKEIHLTEEERSIINENIYHNVVSIAGEYPNVTFYYFFTPYSAVWWSDLLNSGQIYKQIEAEQYIIEKILEYDNIKLFSFNMRTDITTDLNNYRDYCHYAQWINSLILKWMQEGKYQLTSDNYKRYLEKELAFYTSFDYESLNEQEDYEADFYAAALLNQELTGTEPVMLSHYFSNSETFSVTNTDKYRFLAFFAKKNSEHGEFSVNIYSDQTGEIISSLIKSSKELDEEWHPYVLDISQADQSFSIIMSSENTGNMSNDSSPCIFRDITLY